MKQRYKIGDSVTMTEAALENYGEAYRDMRLEVSHVATAHMPTEQFFAKGCPNGFHPGFDASANCALYDFNGINFSLYEWEIR